MSFHLLVVEDSSADARLIRLGVARCEGCAAVFAEDAEIALAVLRREPPHEKAARPDLILLDLNLPRISGHELLALLRADESLKTIPVAVFSGSPNPTDHAQAKANGAAAFVVKPSALEPFVDTVAAVVLGWMAKAPPTPPVTSVELPDAAILEPGEPLGPGAEPSPDPN